MVADPSATTAPVAAVPTNSVAKPAATVTGVDLQLLDACERLQYGDATQQIGPRYRVTFRNAGTSPVDHDFNVALVAADDANLTTNLPTIESRISSVGTGDVKTVDLRLPATAFDMGQDSHSEFAKLVVVVDSHGEVNDVNRDNNMASVDRTAVQPERERERQAPGGGVVAGLLREGSWVGCGSNAAPVKPLLLPP